MMKCFQVLVALIVMAPGCKDEEPPRPVREKVRILIPQSYKAHIDALFDSGVREFSVSRHEIEWVDMPYYRGRDSVFAPSLAARFADSDPDADVLFIDLYRIGSFRPAWLTPFDSGAFENVEELFRPAFLEGAKLADGKVYAIPWSAKGNFLFYRKDLVPDPPRTWTELQRICEQLPQRGISRGMRYCLLVNWLDIQNDLYPVLWGLSQDVTLSSDAVVDFLAELAGMVGQGISQGFLMMPSAKNMPLVGKKIRSRFAAGEAAFMISWNNRFQLMQRALAAEGKKLPPLGIAPIPRIGGTSFSNIGTWGWIVPREPQAASEAARRRHALAMKFVAEVSSKEAVAFLSKRSGLIPARRDVPIPNELAAVLAPEITKALDGESLGEFQFRDRGSDEFIHGFVRDAVREVLTCRTEATRPTGPVGACARVLEHCQISDTANPDCFKLAVRSRLEVAERNIQAQGGGP